MPLVSPWSKQFANMWLSWFCHQSFPLFSHLSFAISSLSIKSPPHHPSPAHEVPLALPSFSGLCCLPLSCLVFCCLQFLSQGCILCHPCLTITFAPSFSSPHLPNPLHHTSLAHTLPVSPSVPCYHCNTVEYNGIYWFDKNLSNSMQIVVVKTCKDILYVIIFASACNNLQYLLVDPKHL